MLLHSLIDKWLPDYADVYTDQVLQTGSETRLHKLGCQLVCTYKCTTFSTINSHNIHIVTYHYDSIPSLNLPFFFCSSLPLPPPPRSSPLPLLTCSLMLSTMCCISDSWVGTVWKRSRPAWSVAVPVQVRNTRVLSIYTTDSTIFKCMMAILVSVQIDGSLCGDV